MDRRQDGTPIAEAARLLGLSQEAVRKRLQRATLAGYKRDDHWYVLLEGQDTTAGQRQDSRPDGRTDDDRTVAGRQDTAPDEPPAPPEPIEAAYRVTPADVERAVERTAAQYMGDLRTVLAEVGKVYEGRIAATEAALAAKDETIAELRRRAERAEAERLAAEEERDALWLRLDAAQAAPEAPGVAEAPSPAVVAVVRPTGPLVQQEGALEGESHPTPRTFWQRLWRALRG